MRITVILYLFVQFPLRFMGAAVIIIFNDTAIVCFPFLLATIKDGNLSYRTHNESRVII